MAHFAELDDGNVVLRVVVVANAELLVDGEESEAKGVSFLNGLLGASRWKQTSYTGSFRKNFAGIGFAYDEGRDAFIPPKPADSWSLDEETCRWVAPVPYPTDGKLYRWDEDTVSWVDVEVSDVSGHG